MEAPVPQPPKACRGFHTIRRAARGHKEVSLLEGAGPEFSELEKVVGSGDYATNCLADRWHHTAGLLVFGSQRLRESAHPAQLPPFGLELVPWKLPFSCLSSKTKRPSEICLKRS